MKINTGLFDHMVLQRGADNRSSAVITGVCQSRGKLLATVQSKGRILPGFNRRVIGQADGKGFQGCLAGLPAGGPYEVALCIRQEKGREESVVCRDVLVGDVWILAGQSNMEGLGRLMAACKPHASVRACFMNDEWGVARDPIHVLGESVDTVHSGWIGPHVPRSRAGRGRPFGVGVGPGLSFGLEMLKRTGVPQGLIACAHGGTSMKQWSPKLKSQGTRSLYGAMLRRFIKNGGKAAGVLWYQGESDTANEKTVREYLPAMKRLVKAVRRDFKSPRLPWAVVQIAGVYNWQPDRARFWNAVQDMQRRLPDFIKNLLVVPAIDLALDDSIHVAGDEMPRLGRRLAEAMCVLRREKSADLPPLEFGNVNIKRDHKHNCLHIVVKFKNVVDRLCAVGRPCGFSLIDQHGLDYAYRTELQGNVAIIRTTALNPNMQLWYGRGLAPYCNITDAADRAVPVFGPVVFNTPEMRRRILRAAKALSVGEAVPEGSALAALVSCALPAPADIRKLACPRNLRALKLKPRKFENGVWDLHYDLFDCAPHDRMVYFVSRLVCPKDMKVYLGVGYDGPMKMWVDGKEVHCDPRGTNPIGIDKALIPFNATRGRHTVIFALTSNHGRAWGMRFRCLPRDAFSKGAVTRGRAAWPKITV